MDPKSDIFEVWTIASRIHRLPRGASIRPAEHKTDGRTETSSRVSAGHFIS